MTLVRIMYCKTQVAFLNKVLQRGERTRKLLTADVARQDWSVHCIIN